MLPQVIGILLRAKGDRQRKGCRSTRCRVLAARPGSRNSPGLVAGPVPCLFSACCLDCSRPIVLPIDSKKTAAPSCEGIVVLLRQLNPETSSNSGRAAEFRGHGQIELAPSLEPALQNPYVRDTVVTQCHGCSSTDYLIRRRTVQNDLHVKWNADSS